MPAERAVIDRAAIPSLIRKLERRVGQIEALPEVTQATDRQGLADRIVADVNATIDDVFGRKTADAIDFYAATNWFFVPYALNEDMKQDDFKRGLERTRNVLLAAIARLKEKQEDADHDSAAKTLRAYEGLDLHHEIARAASQLYRDVTTRTPLKMP